MINDNQTWTIGSDFNIRVVPKEEFEPLFHKYTELFFDKKSQVFRVRNALTDSERSKLKQLGEYTGNPLEIRLGLFKKDEFIGWNYSRQESPFTLYMQNSGVLPEFRRKGLYSELVKKLVEISNQLGFQTVYSRHVATNNDVIIAKLKLDFKITSLELSDVFGVLIHLSYFSSEARKKMLDYRSGFIRPDEEIKKYLDL